jgi:hypothetical protein
MGAGVKKDRADSLMQSADETRLHCVLPLCDGSSGGAGAGPLLSLTTVGPPVPCVFDYFGTLSCDADAQPDWNNIVFRVCLLSHSTLTDYHPRVALLLDILNRV